MFGIVDDSETELDLELSSNKESELSLYSDSDEEFGIESDTEYDWTDLLDLAAGLAGFSLPSAVSLLPTRTRAIT